MFLKIREKLLNFVFKKANIIMFKIGHTAFLIILIELYKKKHHVKVIIDRKFLLWLH